LCVGGVGADDQSEKRDDGKTRNGKALVHDVLLKVVGN
jgi:hypothetical protein